MTKLERANALEKIIKDLEGFIRLSKDGQHFDEKYKKQNNFCGLLLSAYIWTGSDNPKYEQLMNDNESITCFLNAGLEALELKLEEYKKEFRAIFS